MPKGQMNEMMAYGRIMGRIAEEALKKFAERDPATHGIMMKTASGNAIANPLVGAANKAMRDVIRYATELGLTPSARTRVAVETPGDPGDRFFD